MAASAARASFGTTLARLTTPPSTYTNLVEILTVSPPNASQETIDVTHMESPNGAREYIPGIKDGGEVGFTYNWTKAGQSALITAMNAGKTGYKILYPDGSSEAFDGIITSVGNDQMEVNGKMAGSGTIKLSGLSTYTPAA